MATTADIRNGLCIEFKGDTYQIIQFQHVKPGKGAAFVRTKLKSLTTGRVIDNTFPSGAKIDVVRVETRPYQYLYKDEHAYVFMHTETFEQVFIEEHFIENPLLLKEGMEVQIVFHADKEIPLSVELPPHVTHEIVYTEPGVKGDTASSTAMKPAKTETGLEIQVPLFVNTGDLIKIDTRNVSYVERVKK